MFDVCMPALREEKRADGHDVPGAFISKRTKKHLWGNWKLTLWLVGMGQYESMIQAAVQGNN